jgi:hypothetical protein
MRRCLLSREKALLASQPPFREIALPFPWHKPARSLDAAAPEVKAAEDRLSQMGFYDPGYAEAEQTLRLARARAEIRNLQRAAH